MATTVEKLREMGRNAGKDHDKIIRAYYDRTNAQKRGIPLPYAINADIFFAESGMTVRPTKDLK